ncbi:MAG TPA: ABC transporter permease [Thermoanaerobaculia bacterium]|nr:ABC transporter permease [Thermoanaerobaculia bacterium]
MEIREFRLALRSLVRRPSYSLPVLLTVALGIGATTAIFSVVYAVLIRPLPFDDPESLVRVYATKGGRQRTSTPPNFVDIRGGNRSFESMAASYDAPFEAAGGEVDAERLSGAYVTSSFLSVLRVAPILGRGFTPDDERPGHQKVVLLSHGLWTRRYGGAKSIVGSAIRLEGENWTVLGVLPPRFDYPKKTELWAPLAFTADDLLTQRGAHYLDVIARLRPEATVKSANAEVVTIAAQLEKEYPDKNRGWSAEVVSLHESVVGKVRQPLQVLLGAVFLVLLIACVNVINLTLSRAHGRERDLAIRSAIGARRPRLIRELMTESILIALIGGAAGALLADIGVRLLKTFPLERIPRLEEAAVNLPVLLFTAVVSTLCGIVFGLLPALQITAPDLTERLKEGSRGAAGAASARRLRRLLVVSEVALAVTLLAGAGLLMKSFARLQDVDPGFSTANILTFELSLPESRYPKPEQVQALVSRYLEELSALPGVENAAAVFGLPLSGVSYSISFNEVDGVPASDRDHLRTQVRIATPDYNRALSIPLMGGRWFEERDDMASPRVVVVNESAAAMLWPGENPLGHSVTLGTRFGMPERLGGTVVGVVRDVRTFGLAAPAPAEIFFPHKQTGADYLTVVLRTRSNPMALVEPARLRLRQLDPELPISEPRTMADLAADSVSSPRFYMSLVAIFGTIAVLLAAIGIYGVIAFSVDQRTREIGIRLALGARPRDVLRQVLAEGLGLTAIGIAAGVLGGLSVLRFLGGLLYQLSPNDPPTYVAVAFVLAAIALIATWIPARRAMRVEPMMALRYE